MQEGKALGSADHCRFKRDDLARLYKEQLKAKYGALPEFENWLKVFIEVLWKNLNKNVKNDIPTQVDFRMQVADARAIASQTVEISYHDVVGENVVGSVYRQLQPPKMLCDIWSEKSTPLFEKANNTKVIASSGDLSTARNRHVPCKLLDTNDIDTVAGLIQDPSSRVVFVHGESGSGKTVCATCAANHTSGTVTFYIRCPVGDSDSAAGKKDDRDAKARAFVKAKVEGALGRWPDVTCTATTRVVIILDEMGTNPQLARGICATHDVIADEIRAYLMLEGTPVNLVCVGTGVEGTDMAPGSEPSHYVLHRITTSDLWQRWTEEDGKDGELRKVMAESGAWSMLATAMVENARAAALFKDHVHRNLHLCATRSSCLAYLQSAVLETAFEYKSKNGANTITSASAILEALQYPFHRLTSLAPEHLLLARQYGVLTDLATFQSHSDDAYKPVKFVVDGAVRYLEKLETECLSKTHYVEKPTALVLSIPAQAWSRYEMSAAQLALCRIGYGVSPRAPTCDGFEGSVVDFVLFALLAGPPPPQSRLLYDSSSDRHPAFALLDQLYKGETVRPAHVTVYQSHVKIEPKRVPSSASNNQGSCDSISDADCALKDVLDCVKKDLSDNHAVILLNAPTASYADVMVLLPRGRLLLLQCKYHTTGKVPDTDVKDEFTKMGLEDPTAQLLLSLFPSESPCLRDNISRLIVVYGPQEDIPEVDPDTGRYSADGLCNCYVLHLRPDATSNAGAGANEGEEERVEGGATTRAFKSSTTRLLYPVLIAVNIEAAMKKHDRDSF